MKQHKLEILLEKFAKKQLNEEECKEMFALIKKAENDEQIKAWLINEINETKEVPVLENEEWNNTLTKILASNTKNLIPVNERSIHHYKSISQSKVMWQTKTAIAATLVILLSCSVYYLIFKSKPIQIETVKKIPKNDLNAPVINKATIILSNGERILLESANNGTLAKEGTVKVTKINDGSISYSGTNSIIAYNTLLNPRGSSMINITLQDGSKVWLNNESSITYPTAFLGTERKVEITGEVYFEVAKDLSKKFIVSCNGITTEVLGTHFNINTYTGESGIKITLLEGAVKVTKGAFSSYLKPLQQATVNENITVTSGINTEEVTAWKNGFFHFESADLKTILKQFERYYDVEVIYEGKVNNEKLFSIINKQSSLAEVLKPFKANGISYKLEGKKLYINPQ